VPDQGEIVRQREAANAAMRDYLIALVRRRVGELQAGGAGKDPVSRLVRLVVSQALRFDTARVVLNVGGLLIGAVETTSHAAVNALSFLLERPDLLAAARAAAASDDPAAVDGFVYEALRFHPPFPYFFRVCEHDTVLSRGTDHETGVAAGTTVLGVTRSANFDPAAVAEPDRFVPGRELGAGFLFGSGLHECLGRAIGAAMIPEIVRQALRLDDLSVGPVDRKGGPVPEAWAWCWTGAAA
jgi:cytochrome P450